MAVKLQFFLNVNTGELSLSATAKRPYSIPDLTAGDTAALKIGMVEELLTSAPGTLNRLTVTGYTLKVALGTITNGTATVATSVTCTVGTDADGTFFQGNLPLNVAGVTGLLTSANSVRVVMEFEVTDSTGTISHKKSVTIHQQLISTSLIDTPEPDTALGKAEASNTYLKKGENGAGEGFTLVSPDGTLKVTCYLDNQGQVQWSPQT